MYNRIRLLIFTVLITFMSASAVYADRVDTGWNGYGLYNLNKSEVSILNESDNVLINGSNVSAVYEYTIKNNSGKEIAVNFGYPDNGIYKFGINDGSKYLSYKTRNTSYLKSSYGVENLQTPDGRWYLFTMVFTPGQTRTIKVSIEAEMKMEENDTYDLHFFKDRNYSYAVQSESVKFTLKFVNFKPYNIFDLEGLKSEDVSMEGTVALSYSGSFDGGVSINYQPVDQMAIERLNASVYKKPKAIVREFNAKNYNESVTLSNEYISDPSDSKLNLEQVKYVKAESSRLLNNNEEYISLIEQLDISKLYPGRIKYKVLLDKLNVYDAMNNDEAIGEILEKLIPETQQSYPYLNYWLNQNGYKLAQSDPSATDLSSNNGKTVVSKAGKGFDFLGAAMKLLIVVRESKWTYAVLGLIAGFILGRVTKRGKKRKSVYLFRD